VSREVIADSIEDRGGLRRLRRPRRHRRLRQEHARLPIGMARLNRPSIFVYGGTIRPGAGHTDIVSVFEAVGRHAAGELSLPRSSRSRTRHPGPGLLRRHVYRQHHGLGHRSAGHVAAGFSSAQDAISADKASDCFRAGQQVLELLARDIKPRDIMTRKAFENASAWSSRSPAPPTPCCICWPWRTRWRDADAG
jgi:dihydroxy-acid dehydratase